jgi:FAD synthetase
MRTVLVGGVFDILHPGHLWFLEKSKEKGNYLVVVVARDKTVKEKKGRIPVIPEKQRLEMIKNLKIVDKAVLGNEDDFLSTVKKVNPQVVVLGNDQKVDEQLKKFIDEQGIELFKLKEKIDGDLLTTSRIISKIRKGF